MKQLFLSRQLVIKLWLKCQKVISNYFWTNYYSQLFNVYYSWMIKTIIIQMSVLRYMYVYELICNHCWCNSTLICSYGTFVIFGLLQFIVFSFVFKSSSELFWSHYVRRPCLSIHLFVNFHIFPLSPKIVNPKFVDAFGR